MEERFKFRHVHAITGTFVLLVLGVLIAALVFAGRSQRWFIGNVTLRIVLPEDGAGGIRQGSDVYFLGTLMGTVTDVRVDPSGRMEARAHIRRDFFLFVRADSSAVVKRKFGVAGDSFFEISRGKGAPLPEDNASIVCNEQHQSALEAAVEEIRRETLLVLKKTSASLDTWATLGTNLIKSGERADQFIARADAIAADLQEGKGTAGQLLSDSFAADELKTLLQKANHSMDEFRVTLANVQTASSNLQLASISLPAISEAIGNEAKVLPGTVLQTQTSLRELERLIEAMQRHWFLRKYVNPTNPAPIHPVAKAADPERKPLNAFRAPRDSTR